MARRDNGEKNNISIDESFDEIEANLENIQSSLFKQAADFMNKNTFSVSNYDEFKKQD